MGVGSSLLQPKQLLDRHRLDHIWEKVDRDHSGSLEEKEIDGLVRSLASSLHLPAEGISVTLSELQPSRNLLREQFNFALVYLLTTLESHVTIAPDIAAQFLSPIEAVRQNQADVLSNFIQTGLSLPYRAIFLAVELDNAVLLEQMLRSIGEALSRELNILVLACERRSLPLVQAVLRSAVEPRTLLNHANTSGVTPLMKSCQLGDREIVDVLLEAGADLYANDSNGHTCLTLACEAGHQELVDRLLAVADIDRLNQVARASPLWFAAKSGVVALVEALARRYPAWVNEPDRRDNLTPLSIACQEGKEEVVFALLHLEADITVADSKGSPPLHHAALSCPASTICLLLAAGAPTRATSAAPNNFPIAQVLQSFKYKKFKMEDRTHAVELLLAFDADPDRGTLPLPEPADSYQVFSKEKAEFNDHPLNIIGTYHRSGDFGPIVALLMSRARYRPHRELLQPVLNSISRGMWATMTEQERITFRIIKLGFPDSLRPFVEMRFRFAHEEIEFFSAVLHAPPDSDDDDDDDPSSKDEPSSATASSSSSSSTAPADADEAQEHSWSTLKWEDHVPEAYSTKDLCTLAIYTDPAPHFQSMPDIVPVGFKRDPNGGWYRDPDYDWGDEEMEMRRLRVLIRFGNNHQRSRNDGRELDLLAIHARRLNRKLRGKHLIPLPSNYQRA